MSLISLSDIHLGASNCEAKKVLEVLDRAKDYEEIIINGDLIDSHLYNLRRKHWEVLSELSKLSRKRRVIYVRGNHDDSSGAILSSLTGMEISDSYQTTIRGVSFHFEHGHLYDEFIINNPGLTAIADTVYSTLQWIDPTHNLARWAKEKSKAFLRCKDKIKNGVAATGKVKNADWSVAGHTHFAEFDEKLGYINLGCFTEKPCTYLTVNKHGEPRLNYL